VKNAILTIFKNLRNLHNACKVGYTSPVPWRDTQTSSKFLACGGRTQLPYCRNLVGISVDSFLADDVQIYQAALTAFLCIEAKVRFSLFSRRYTSWRCCDVRPMMIISSRYANALGSMSGPITLSSARWNVAGAEWRPNGMTFQWYSPLPGTVNAVHSRLVLAVGICKYPLFRSRVEMYFAWRNRYRMWVILGSGFASGIERAFSCRKSTHNLISPNFLLTSTIGALWGLREGSMQSLRNKSSICSSIILCIAEFLGKYLCLMGLSSRIVIECSAMCDTTVSPSN